MPKASGADIKIGDHEFMLDGTVDEPYVKRWYDVDDEEDPRITGDPGKVKRNPESLFWTYTDWAGGEGYRNYDVAAPDSYNVAYELNPRIRGQLTGRPERNQITLSTKDVTDRPVLCIGGGGALWCGRGYELDYAQDDLTSWTGVVDSTTAADDDVGLRSLNTNYRITAMAGDNDYIYYSAWNSANSGERVTLRRGVGTGTALADTVQAESTGVAPFAGLAIMGGKLYAWTGRRLWEMDIDSSAITTSVSGGVTTAADTLRKVYDTRTDPASTNVFSTSWWAECVATENSVVFWYSSDGASEVYEYKKGVGRPIWRPPYGFTIKGSCYSNGIMYFSGHWGGDSNATGEGVLYAMPMDTYEPIPLKRVRAIQNNNLQMQEMHASYGYQVITVAQRTGRIFVYDAQTDGLTMLDDLERASGSDPDGLTFTNNSSRIAGSATWGPYRVFTVYEPGGSGAGDIQIVYYKDDRPQNIATDLNTTDVTGYKGYFETPRWDFNYPLDKKTLVGFHLMFKPLVANQFIDVYYDASELTDDTSTATTNWTQLTQITSATSGASVGRVFLPVSTGSATVKFLTLRFRVYLSSGPTGTVAAPILFAVSAEAQLARKRKEWILQVRVKDEQSKIEAPSSRRRRGWRIRDHLETLIETGSAVTFHDGYRYKDDALYGTHYSSHNVIIKDGTDVITKRGEGTMQLVLRDIDLQDDA